MPFSEAVLFSRANSATCLLVSIHGLAWSPTVSIYYTCFYGVLKHKSANPDLFITTLFYFGDSPYKNIVISGTKDLRE